MHPPLDDHLHFISDCGCVVWSGFIASGIPKYNGKPVRRIMYEKLIGEIPDGLETRNTCGNPSCVSVDHMELVPRRYVSVANRVRNTMQKTHCKHGHELIGDNVIINKRGQRQCRACNVRMTQEWRKRNRKS